MQFAGVGRRTWRYGKIDMQKTINGYTRDLPHIAQLTETRPGFGEGTVDNDAALMIVGGTRAGYGRSQWYAICPRAFGPEPKPAKSLAQALTQINAALTVH